MAHQRSVKSNPLISTQKNIAQAEIEETNPLYGIYVGEVMSHYDKDRNGTILVFIDAFGKDKSDPNNYTPCAWSSPFAGSTPVAAVGKNLERYAETQKSYGMWMIPPDIGNLVLVAFANGIEKNAYIISCIFPSNLNHMVPGMPGGTSYGEGRLQVPVAEKNIKEQKVDHNSKSINRPIAPYLTEKIVKQGLINDAMRGPGSAGARRESPSQVFGILTPGPLKGGSSASSEGTVLNAHRIGGHQFIMDDNPGSSMIRLRTARGTQLTLNDATGTIYMINRDGTAWIELTALGDILIYGKGSMNIRSKGNLNLRADKNVNIEAGNDINIRAAGDNTGDQYLGPAAAGLPPLGTGGSINLDAARDIKQYASQNFGITAKSGGTDISSAGPLKATATAGIHLLSSTGPLAVRAATGISLTSLTSVGISATGVLGLVGKPINLNSGDAPTIPVLPAKGPAQIGLNNHTDQPLADPEFDLNAALEGKSAIKNNGERPGKADTIKSIVTNLVTAEPYTGHSQADAASKEDPTAVGADEAVTQDTPPAASTLDGKPDDAQTPAGSKAGESYVDNNGNTVSQPTNSPSLASRARNAVASAQTAAQGATGSVTNRLNKEAAKANAEISKLRDAIPTYADIQNVFNDFTTALEKKIDEVLGLSAFVASIKAQIPPIRFPTTNALQQDIIASIKQLKELEAQLKQFSLDKFGLPIDLNIPAIQDMKNQINGVMAQAKSGLDAVNKLKELGIDVVNDAGSLIYRDSLGNTLVDFSNGVGPVASSLAIQSEIAQTYKNIKNVINVPINNNQAQALSAFAKDIGIENFRNSSVLQALNEGRYNEVPRLMSQWSLGAPLGSETPTPLSELVFRQDLKDKRYFQGQVFQSPDNLDIGPPSGTADGELTPRQMGDLIKSRREEFNAANYAGPTTYYSGPRG